MKDRQEMLNRVRRALGRTAQGHAERPEEHLPPARLEGVMLYIAPEELLANFETELGKAAGSAHRVSTVSELDDLLGTILNSSQAAAVVLSRNPLLAQLAIEQRVRSRDLSVAFWPAEGESDRGKGDVSGDFKATAFAATVGITGVDFALAETGTLVLSSVTEGSQLASLAPPVHMALYRRSQLIGSLDDLLERIPVSRDPRQPSPGRSVVFITGTSRTADIEQILIRGVHGPREVYAILVEESCLGGS